MIYIKKKNENLITTKDGLTRFSIESLIVLAALMVYATYLYGYVVLWHVGLSCIFAMLTEAFAIKVFGMKGSLKDMSAVTTGMMIALMLPASCPKWVAPLGSVFAVAVAKLPFGGARRTPFVPAAAGWCFLSVCFSNQVYSFTAVTPGESPAVYGTEGYTAAQSLSQMLKLGKTVNLNTFGADSLLTGKIPGAMGTTCVIVFIGVVLFLLIKRPKRLICSAGFIAVCAFVAFVFPRTSGGRMSSVVCELCAGNLLFTALLTVNEPVTCPKGKRQAFCYGAVGGLVCILLSYYGKYSDNACFSVLIMNAVWPAFEDVRQYFIHGREERKETKKERENGGSGRTPISYKVNSYDLEQLSDDEYVTHKKQHTPIQYEPKTVLQEDDAPMQLSFKPVQPRVTVEETEDDDALLPPDVESETERLKKIEEMFYKDIVKPVRQRREEYGMRKAYLDIYEELSADDKKDSEPDIGKDDDSTPDFSQIGTNINDLDYRSYLSETEDNNDE